MALLVGIWAGALLVSGFNPVSAFLRTFDTYFVGAFVGEGNAEVLLFTFLLGGTIGLVQRSGGALGLANALKRFMGKRERGDGCGWRRSMRLPMLVVLQQSFSSSNRKWQEPSTVLSLVPGFLRAPPAPVPAAVPIPRRHTDSGTGLHGGAGLPDILRRLLQHPHRRKQSPRCRQSCGGEGTWLLAAASTHAQLWYRLVAKVACCAQYFALKVPLGLVSL